MDRNINTIIFDYGGTLDTDGIHWSEKFFEIYRHFNVQIDKESFRNAFVYSERTIPGIIKPDFSLKQTYKAQMTYQREYLIETNLLSTNNMPNIDDMIDYCYSQVVENMKKTKIVLDSFLGGYKLGLVSNYYGNVETIINEMGLKKYFNSITDSTVVGVRKPDQRIFEIALNDLGSLPGKSVVVGDSLRNDIVPFKKLGGSTIWIKGKGWGDESDSENADEIVTTIADLPGKVPMV